MPQPITAAAIRAWMQDVLQSRGWSANEWARRAGVSGTTITRAIKPEYEFTPSTSTLTKLASVPGVPPLEGLPATNLPMVPVIGYVGANPEGSVLYATGQESGDLVPLPPGGSERAVALEVRGHSMRGWADDGALIYFESQHTTPTPDMLGHVVVCELPSGEVLVKRLLRGSKPGLYDLESIAGPTRSDVRLKWVAEITAVIPPKHAQRIIVRGGIQAA